MTENVTNDAEFVESKFLTAGMEFSPVVIRTITTKQYNRLGVKILDESGDIYFTTAAKIAKVFTDLTETEYLGKRFTVVQKGTYNGHPVLSVVCNDGEINRKIMKILF